MNTETQKPISEMTTQELEAFLKHKKASEAKLLEKEKIEYEKKRDDIVIPLVFIK